VRLTNCQIERIPLPARPFWKVLNDSVGRWVQVPAPKLDRDAKDTAKQLFAASLSLRGDAKAMVLCCQACTAGKYLLMNHS